MGLGSIVLSGISKGFTAIVLAASGLACGLSACSALVDPDPSQLGGGDPIDPIGSRDGGLGPESDSGMHAPSDTGTPPNMDATVTDGSTPPEDARPKVDGSEVDGGPRCPNMQPLCQGDVLVSCEGSELVEETCAAGCIATAARCARPEFSNLPVDAFQRDAPDVALPSGEFSFNTDECAANVAPTRVLPQRGSAPSLCVLSTGSFELGAGSRLRVVGSRPLAVAAMGEIVIAGTLDASARGPQPGPGGASGGTRVSPDGSGVAPGDAGNFGIPYDDGGGGGGALCGAGGDGGRGGLALGGSGGAAIAPDWGLSPLIGGSGGGRGRGEIFTNGDLNAGDGGGGGGALQLASMRAIRITGTVLVGGGGGGGGKTHGGRNANWGSGGGGGSGGALLLEAPTVELLPLGLLGAAGGGGGGAAGFAGDGIGGQDGAETDQRARGGFGSGTGGYGGGADSLDGDEGEDASDSSNNGAGGGGGAGCIFVRSATPPMLSGRATGSVAPGLRTGTLVIQ